MLGFPALSLVLWWQVFPIRSNADSPQLRSSGCVNALLQVEGIIFRLLRSLWAWVYVELSFAPLCNDCLSSFLWSVLWCLLSWGLSDVVKRPFVLGVLIGVIIILLWTCSWEVLEWLYASVSASTLFAGSGKQDNKRFAMSMIKQMVSLLQVGQYDWNFIYQPLFIAFFSWKKLIREGWGSCLGLSFDTCYHVLKNRNERWLALCNPWTIESLTQNFLPLSSLWWSRNSLNGSCSPSSFAFGMKV